MTKTCFILKKALIPKIRSFAEEQLSSAKMECYTPVVRDAFACTKQLGIPEDNYRIFCGLYEYKPNDDRRIIMYRIEFDDPKYVLLFKLTYQHPINQTETIP